MKEPSRRQWAELAQKYGLGLVALFGSHAKGTAHEGSDVDVAIRAAEVIDLATEIKVRRDVARLWDIPVDALDLIVLSQETNVTLAFNIARQGRQLFESEENAWKLFREETRHRWLADAPRRRARNESLMRWTQEIARRGQESRA
ncbi:MAG: nucleotidyltransferase domain-containing protein [Chloroflexi bacterium]|nr:nucleotidyltransferase domain-containing protein [Chloroflexota bacterium]